MSIPTQPGKSLARGYCQRLVELLSCPQESSLTWLNPQPYLERNKPLFFHINEATTTYYSIVEMDFERHLDER